jgi:hypothetical protein
LLGSFYQVAPAAGFFQKEDIVHIVELRHFNVFLFAFGNEPCPVFFKLVAGKL